MMNVESALSRFKQEAAALNEASDSVNHTIAAIEKQLVEANAGLEVWLTDAGALDRTLEERVTLGGTEALQWTEQYLGLAKFGPGVEGWHLAVRHHTFVAEITDDDSEPESPEDRGGGRATTLSQASRQVRIKALELIPILIGRLGEAVDRAVKTIEESKKLIR
jgi:hypothetical protein